MNSLLRDLYDHQVWADAEHWRAIGAHPPARDDQTIRRRLHHIAIVQRAFLWAVGDRQEQFAFGSKWRVIDSSRKFHRDVSVSLAGACFAAGEAVPIDTVEENLHGGIPASEYGGNFLEWRHPEHVFDEDLNRWM